MNVAVTISSRDSLLQLLPREGVEARVMTSQRPAATPTGHSEAQP